MVMKSARWITDLQDLLLPRFCPVCGQRLMPSERIICMTCSIGWPRIKQTSLSDNSMLRLLWPRVPVELATSLIAYRHDMPFHNIIVNIKYHGASHLAVELGRWAARELMHQGLLEQSDLIVPVPISPKKRRRRGYNQAQLLAEGMSQECHLPVRTWLSRANDQETQTHLNRARRIENTISAFQACIPPEERGHRILIVDDVFTTGATIASCAQALLQADATATINVFTLSYSPSSDKM
jgi:ComF family protein